MRVEGSSRLPQFRWAMIALLSWTITAACLGAGHGVIDDTPALIAHWPFDEGTGAVSRGRGNAAADAVLVGVGWAPGISGTALHFNGAGAHVRIPAFGASMPTEHLSFAMWVKMDAPTGPWLERRPPVRWSQTLFILDTNPEAHDRYFLDDNQFFCLMPNKLGGTAWAFGDPGVFGGGTWVWNGTDSYHAWHHYVFVADEYMLMYIDGEKYWYGWSQDTVRSATPSNADLYIGGIPALPDSYFEGTVDEVALYDHALSASEIKRLYESYGEGAGQ